MSWGGSGAQDQILHVRVYKEKSPCTGTAGNTVNRGTFQLEKCRTSNNPSNFIFICPLFLIESDSNRGPEFGVWPDFAPQLFAIKTAKRHGLYAKKVKLTSG